MLYKKVKKAENLKDMQFYAFSYYYDKGVDLGIIGMLMLLLLLLLLSLLLFFGLFIISQNQQNHCLDYSRVMDVMITDDDGRMTEWLKLINKAIS